MASGDSFIGLRQYIKGKISKWELMDVDKAIEDVYEKDDRGLSELVLNVGQNNFLKLLGLSDEDISVYNTLMSSYGEIFEVYEQSSIMEDTIEGYGRFWSDLDEDNQNLLSEIAKYISPGVDFDVPKSRGEFFKLLSDAFPKETDNIISELTNELNGAIDSAMKNHVRDQVNAELESLNIQIVHGTDIKLTVNQLISYFIENDALHLSIKKLFNTIFKEESGNIGGFMDDYYTVNYENYYDISSVNRTINWNLEKILDITEENEIGDEDEIVSKNKQYLDMLKSVTTYFNIGTWYDLPKNKNYSFRIDGFERLELKVNVTLKTKKNYNQKRFKFSVENFFKLLFQPELFDFDEVYGFEN